MFSFKSIVLIAAAFAIGAEASGLPAVAAPLIAPAQVGYAHAVPQNIPPYASQINVQTKSLSPLVAAPVVAGPFGAPVAAPFAAPLAAPLPAPLAAPAPFVAPAPYAAAAPYFAPSPYLPGPYAAPYALPGPAAYAAPYPYAASPLLRAPYGVAPAFVR